MANRDPIPSNRWFTGSSSLWPESAKQRRPLLSHEEEIKLAIRRDRGDLAARNELAERNLPLAIRIADRWIKNNPSHAESIASAALEGLLHAADKFDPALGCRFSTCAYPWIIQAIRRGKHDEWSTIRVPAHTHEKLSKKHGGKQREPELGVDADHGPDPDPTPFFSPSHVKQIWAAERALLICSIDAERAGRRQRPGLSMKLRDLIPGADPDPAEAVCEADLLARVATLLDRLPPRERRIMVRRFGLDGDEPGTFSAIGEEIGLTRARIEQLVRKSLEMLRRGLERDGKKPS